MSSAHHCSPARSDEFSQNALCSEIKSNLLPTIIYVHFPRSSAVQQLSVRGGVRCEGVTAGASGTLLSPTTDRIYNKPAYNRFDNPSPVYGGSACALRCVFTYAVSVLSTVITPPARAHTTRRNYELCMGYIYIVAPPVRHDMLVHVHDQS